MGAGDSEFPEVCPGFKIVVKSLRGARKMANEAASPAPMAIRWSTRPAAR
jgi:hypothetical protein